MTVQFEHFLNLIIVLPVVSTVSLFLTLIQEW